MFRLADQPGLLLLLHSERKKPLALWDKRLREGELKRVFDPDLKSSVLELTGNNGALTNYLGCPSDPRRVLAVKYPYLRLTVKSLPDKFFAVDILVLDDKRTRRRFRCCTHQGFLDVQPFITKIPLSLEEGWNEITVPLHRYVKDLYNATYLETLRIQIYANCSLKRVLFSDKEYKESDLPKNCKIYGFQEEIPEKEEPSESEFSHLTSFLNFFNKTS